MKPPEMKTGLTISALAHAALLLWGLISFSARPLEAAPTDALPVDIISEKQFSELTKGMKNARKGRGNQAAWSRRSTNRAQPDDAFAKVAKKQEIKTASEPPPPPPRRCPSREPKPSPKRSRRLRSIRSPKP